MYSGSVRVPTENDLTSYFTKSEVTEFLNDKASNFSVQRPLTYANNVKSLNTDLITSLPSDVSIGSTSIQSNDRGSGTPYARIELGGNRFLDGYSHIDFHSVPGSDYEFRIIRNPGVNGIAAIVQTGTGALNITAPSTIITSPLSVTGTVLLDNATSNFIQFRNTPTDPPTYTTRSLGTKILLYFGLSLTASDYALGVSNYTLWYSVPNSGHNHCWYHGTFLTMTLTGSNLILSMATPRSELFDSTNKFYIGAVLGDGAGDFHIYVSRCE